MCNRRRHVAFHSMLDVGSNIVPPSPLADDCSRCAAAQGALLARGNANALLMCTVGEKPFEVDLPNSIGS